MDGRAGAARDRTFPSLGTPLFSAAEESSWLMRAIPVIAADMTAYSFKPEESRRH